MRRTLYISLLVLSLVAGGLPVTETLAKWSRRAAAVGHHRRHRRHSRAWWRRHRALMRARRERAERRQQQQLAAGQAFAPSPARWPGPGALAAAVNAAPLRLVGPAAEAGVARGSQLPFDFQVPRTWTPLAKAPAGAAAYSVQTPDGRQAG